MAQLEAKIVYSGAVTPVTLGAAGRTVTVGGETSYPFHLFEGAMPNRPRIALEVVDTGPGQGSGRRSIPSSERRPATPPPGRKRRSRTISPTSSA